MFEFNFTTKDFIRSVWTFLAVYIVTAGGQLLGVANDLVESCKDACDFTSAKAQGIAVLIALASAILLAFKNLLLKDGSTLKG
jgi:hypothetical protein